MRWGAVIFAVFAVAISLTAWACDDTVAGSAGGERDVVRLNVLMEPDATGVWRELFAEFHRLHPDIIVNHVEGPSATNSREDQYVASFLSGQAAYDLVFADVVWVPKFAAAGWLEDLTDLWPAERWTRFIPSTVEGGSYRGRIYRVPTQMDGGLLYYRSDLLEAAGEQPPRTLDDMVRISRKLQRPDGELWGFVWQGKQYEGLICDFVEILAAYGGTWIDVESGAVGLDQPPAIAAVRFMVDCVSGLGSYEISPPGVTTYTEEESRRIFHDGRAVFLRNWPYAWGLSQRANSPVRGKVGMIPMPATAAGQSAATLGGWGFGIARSSRHKDAAWRFIEFISALPRALRIREATGGNPALREFFESSSDPAIRAIYEVYQRTIPRPPLPQYAQASDILQRYVSAALTGRQTPEDALRKAARETRLLLGQRATQ